MSLSRIALGWITATGVVVLCAQSVRPGPPFLGAQTNFNRHEAALALLYSADFEFASEDFVQSSVSVSFTAASSEVISGQYSLRLSGERPEVYIRSNQLTLQPEQTYIVEYDYRVLRTGTNGPRVSVVFTCEGTTIDLGGPASDAPASGRDSRGFRTPAGGCAYAGFRAAQSEVVIDNVQVYRQQTNVLRGSVPRVNLGYPRIAAFANKYSAYSRDAERQRELLSRFDMVLGLEADATLGGASEVLKLRARNPNLLLLSPQTPGLARHMGDQPMGTSAGLNALFNSGLDPNWFLNTPLGERVTLADQPEANVLNISRFAPPGASGSQMEYSVGFLSDAVLASGLWDGVEVKETHWFPNPRLRASGRFPAIDLERQGQGAGTQTLLEEWRDGYIRLLRGVADRTGETRLILGSPGYFSPNPSILGLANGWVADSILPFRVLSNGSFDTRENGAWHRLMTTYALANRYVRAPQVNTLQFSGAGLGRPTGKLLPSGLFERFPELEPRDFTRMRFGLGTTLLGDGFFNYTLVDRTSQAEWFDEYAVDTTGTATRSGTGKGYLGQPLGDGYELPYELRPVAQLDFESPVEKVTLIPGPNARVTSDPKQVISGKNSLLVTYDSSAPGDFFVATAPGSFALEVGKTYTAQIDYRILDYRPAQLGTFLAFGFFSAEEGWDQHRAVFLSYEDIDLKNPGGMLRVSVKVTRSDVFLLGRLIDRGSVVVDNIRILEAQGGAWRRDFENGIVLVNPTPEAKTLTQLEVAGKLSRTRARRIFGTQAPEVNSGAPVTQGLTLASGDAVILLADPLPTPELKPPLGLSTDPAEQSVRLAWMPDGSAPAGFRIRLGEDILNASRSVAAGQTTQLTITGLMPGTRYSAQIASCDGRGCGDYSEPVSFTTKGERPPRPQFRLAAGTSAFSPGGVASLIGYDLASGYFEPLPGNLPTQAGSTIVRINGRPVPIKLASETQIDIVAPYWMGGDDVVVTVENHGVESPPRIVPVLPATPELLLTPSETVRARAAVTGRAITSSDPALPGEVVELDVVGLGAVTTPPAEGQAPVGAPINTLKPVEVMLAGSPVSVLSSTLSPVRAGHYQVRFAVPSATQAGQIPVQVRSGGEESNVAILPVKRQL